MGEISGEHLWKTTTGISSGRNYPVSYVDGRQIHVSSGLKFGQDMTSARVELQLNCLAKRRTSS